MNIKQRILIFLSLMTVFFGSALGSELDIIDPKLWTSLEYWKGSDQVLSLANQDKRELFGKVISCAGECELYRKKQAGLLNDGMSLYEGDEIHLAKNSHLWLTTISGDLFRVYPGTTLGLNEINYEKSHWFLFMRLNSGGISRVTRQTMGDQFYSGLDSDQRTLPVKWQKANISYWLRKNGAFKERSRYHFLNQLLKENKLNTKSEVLLLAPNITAHAKVDSDFHFFHEADSSSFLYLKKGELSVLKRNFGENKHELEETVWYQTDAKGLSWSKAKIDLLENRKFNKLTSKIMTHKIARELILKDFKTKKEAKVLKYQEWEEEELKKRVKFLKHYTQRLERSFLVSKDKIGLIKTEANFSLETINKQCYLNEGDHQKHSKNLRKEIKKMSDLGYRLWIAKRSRER